MEKHTKQRIAKVLHVTGHTILIVLGISLLGLVFYGIVTTLPVLVDEFMKNKEYRLGMLAAGAGLLITIVGVFVIGALSEWVQKNLPDNEN